MPRYALRVSDQLMDAAAQITGNRMEVSEDHQMFILLTPICLSEWNVKFITGEEMLYEYSNDSTLEVIQ